MMASLPEGPATVSVTHVPRLTMMAPKYEAYFRPQADSRTVRLRIGRTVPDNVAHSDGVANNRRADGGLTTVIVRYGCAVGATATGSFQKKY